MPHLSQEIFDTLEGFSEQIDLCFFKLSDFKTLLQKGQVTFFPSENIFRQTETGPNSSNHKLQN